MQHAAAPWLERIRELALAPLLHSDSYPVSYTAYQTACLLAYHLADTLTRPGIFATEDKGYSLEWSSPHTVTTLEVDGHGVVDVFHMPAHSNASIHRDGLTLDGAVTAVNNLIFSGHLEEFTLRRGAPGDITEKENS